MNDYNFGNFLCMLREQKGMTQAELAQRLSVTPAAVSKWENGESKPRIETLFQLAEILGVTAEELMAGKFLRTEVPDDAQVEAIRRRYDYLTRIDTLLTTGVRIKRIIAYTIDWNLAGAPFISLCVGIAWRFIVFGTGEESAMYIYAILMLLGIVAWQVGFVFRDFICKGRSVGKRIMGLVVIDRKSGEKASKKQLALRNIFFLFQFHEIDGIIMLVRGMSIGDSVAQTLVVSKKQWLEKGENLSGELGHINSYSNPKKDAKKALMVVAALVAFNLIIVSPFFGMFLKFKNDGAYTGAREYVV